jgi:PEP-CTERM motif
MGNIRAGVIGFDDLPAVACGGAEVPASYDGLNWYGWGYDNATEGACSNSGYAAALASPPNIAFNLGGFIEGYPSDITSPTPFTILSGSFAAAWNDGLIITVTGKLHGLTVGGVSFTVDTTSQTLEIFDFGPVTELDFSAAGGTPHPGALGSGWNFGMDDLTTAPEPATMACVGGGLLLLGIAAVRRRRTSGAA